MMNYPIINNEEYNPTHGLHLFVNYYAGAFKNKKARLEALVHDDYCKQVLGDLYQGLYDYFLEVE